MKSLSTLLVLLAFMAPPVWAKPAMKSMDGPDAAAVALVDLFDQTCVAYAGRFARLKVYLDANMTIANDRQSKYFLDDMAGKVWLREDKEAGNYAIVVYDDGLCAVKAEKAPMDDVVKYFTGDAMARMKLAVKQTGSSTDETYRGLTGRMITYALVEGGSTYKVVLVGTQQRMAALQAQMALSQGAP